MRARLDHWVENILTLFDRLALPVIGLLFLQWPLRDLVQAGSREANDLGQICFALLIASSITRATRAGAHLKSDLLARHLPATLQTMLHKTALVVGLLPWACFILWAGWPSIAQSVLQQERFAETGHSGYFLIKAALMVMALLIIVQGVLDVTKPPSRTHGQS